MAPLCAFMESEALAQVITNLLVNCARHAAGAPVQLVASRRAVAATARRDRDDLEERWSRLTPREREVAERLASGMRPTAIAERFVVSVGTVRTRIRSILAELEVSSQLEAAALARRTLRP